ncbi:MAG: hypothetical protein ABSG92_08240 [Conexivisphaerales archaeon]
MRELYQFDGELAALHPDNKNVRPKIRQQLQILRSKGLLTFESWERLNRELNWFDLYQFLGDRFGRFREWKVGLTGRAVETVNREIPSLYAERDYDKILEYVHDEMEGYELVYNAIKREKFYSELMALRERLLR